MTANSEPADIAAPYACRTPVHGTAAPASGRPAPEGAADFDGDGHSDLAFGSRGSVNGGSIEVAYGAGDGTGVGRCQYLTQDDAGIPLLMGGGGIALQAPPSSPPRVV
ncbi:hypothetical protein [Streptomyces sp. WG5]|uniref:hypothetical protein n=1 Tax=Streptomyces sp. WG5 TaxID=3417648 RepID=UPI003CF79F17